jgi:hypothetical protein
MKASTLSIDRQYRGVGRLKKSTGSTLPKVRRQILTMLDALHDEGRLDVLRAVRDGGITLLELRDAYQRNSLASLPIGATGQPLAVAMREWIDSLVTEGPAREVSPKHQVSLGMSLKYLTRTAGVTVADLPQVLEKLRDTLGKQHPRSYNLARAAALAFVRGTLKRNHPLWAAVAAVEPRTVVAAVQRSPLSPEQMRRWFPSPDTDAVDAIAWGMATTGMGGGEYWGDWSVEDDRVLIHGTKRAGRDRAVPLLRAPTPPGMHRRTFEDKFRERTQQVTPYDLRRTYANWLEAAGVPRTRRRQYLGHGAGDVTGLYELHEVESYLLDDAHRLREFVGGGHTKSHTMTLLKAEGA